MVSSFDGATDFLEHERTALLSTARDPDALADMLIHALDHPVKMQALAQAGKKLFDREFSIDAMCLRYHQQFLPEHPLSG